MVLCLPLAAHRWQRAPGASSRPGGTATRLGWLVALLALAVLFAGPAIARHGLVQRQAFWTTELARVPAEASVEQVRQFLGHDGVAMDCETPNADGLMFCNANDRKGFGLFPRWRISFLVSFSNGRLDGIDQIAGADLL
jgi:hypothetical protein